MRHLTSLVRCVLVGLVAMGLGACGSKGPADELGPAIRVLGEPGGPTVSRTAVVYDVLDEATRRAVDQRASALGAALGRKVEPAEAIQFRGFDPNVRVADVEVVDDTGERATLKVTLARVNDAGGLMPDPIMLQAVREDGRWRLSMPTLATAVAAAAPVPAPVPAAPAPASPAAPTAPKTGTP